jgi:hypothetical protein
MGAPKSLIQSAENNEVEAAGDQRSGFRDEIIAAVTGRFRSGTSAGSTARSRAWSLAPYGWLALLILTNAVVSTLSSVHDAALRGQPHDLLRPAYFDATGALCTLFLLPMLRQGIDLLGRCRSWMTTLLTASLVASLYGLAHIAILIPIRKLSFGIVGGSYHFDWLSQGPYDFRREIIAAMVLGGAFWLFDRTTPEPAGASARAETAPAEEPWLWLRDGTTAVRVEPRAIVTVSSAGNYVEFGLADKSYLIRATLAGEELRLRPFGLKRVHRTRLVNLHHVVAVEPRPGGDFDLRMDNGLIIHGSRRYKDAVKTMIDPARSQA